MAKLAAKQDAFGQAMWDYAQGRSACEITELDSGFVGVSPGPAAYLAEYRDWPTFQKRAIALARGKVLDVGCGAGRVALYLQSKGLDVTGIDNSPLAIKLCRKRGLKKAKVMSITQLTRRLGVFDMIVMYGNNFGLVGSFNRARWLLRRFHNMTIDDARILAESNDPYAAPTCRST
ncbi:MAG: class I SAM-dependent methyltransferase [Planctomycetota bacterium]|jgi:SAM-dependent methyltransferase